MAANKPLGDGSVYLISSGGIWVAHPKGRKCRQDRRRNGAEILPWFNDAMAGKTTEIARISRPRSNSNVYRIFTPIQLGESEKPWIVVTNLVADTIDEADARKSPTSSSFRLCRGRHLSWVVMIPAGPRPGDRPGMSLDRCG